MNAAERALFEQVSRFAAQIDSQELLEYFADPVVIFAAPRSGSTLLFETLKTAETLWTIGGESHIAFSGLPQLHPREKNFVSGRLSAEDATDPVCHWMRSLFLWLAKNHQGQRYMQLAEHERPVTIRFLEKTPRNALNIGFMRKVFPSMRALFLYRDPRENIASIIEAWDEGGKTGRFVTFRDLPKWDRDRWCLLLPPGWQELRGCSLAEIATFQWRSANQAILDDLRTQEGLAWLSLSYDKLINATRDTIDRVAAFIDIPMTGELRKRVSQPLPLSNTIVKAPQREKWKKHEQVIQELQHAYAPLQQALDALGGM